MTEQAPTSRYDVVIAGGGMTGALLALRLLTQTPSLKLAIIEQASSPQKPAVSFDSRSIALSAASLQILSDWGLWAELKTHACAIEFIEVSDQGHIGKSYLRAAKLGMAEMGRVVELEWVGDLVYQKLASLPVRWYRPDHIVELTTHQHAQQLTLQSGQTVETALLVLAEGGQSPTRELAGIGCVEHDYQQTALIANIGLSDREHGPALHQHKAYERFTPSGPLALLPLTRQRYSLVWTLPHAKAEELLALPQAEFLAQLQQAAGQRVGRLQTVGERVLYPLKLRQATSASQHRLVLAGNSLHSLHPIAGQGFNLALRDLDALAQLLKTADDAGAYQVTSRYQQLRTPDMQQVVQWTDGLVRLFSNDSKLIAFGRTLGLSGLDRLPPVKSWFAEQMMGLAPLKRQRQQLAQWTSKERTCKKPMY